MTPNIWKQLDERRWSMRFDCYDASIRADKSGWTYHIAIRATGDHWKKSGLSSLHVAATQAEDHLAKLWHARRSEMRRRLSQNLVELPLL